MGNITFTLPAGNDEGCKYVVANPTIVGEVMTVRPNLIAFDLATTTPTATVPETNTVAVAVLRALSGCTETRTATGATIAQPANISLCTITDAAPNSFDYEDVADGSISTFTVGATPLTIAAWVSATKVKVAADDTQAAQNWSHVRALTAKAVVTTSGGISTVTTDDDFFHYRAGETSPDVGRTVVIGTVAPGGATIVSVTSAKTATFVGSTASATKRDISITRSGTGSAKTEGAIALQSSITTVAANGPSFVPSDVGKTIVTPTAVSSTITGWGGTAANPAVYVDADLTTGSANKTWSITNTVA